MIKKFLQNPNVKKSVYVIVWGIISFVSSFSDILHGEFSFVTINDIEKRVFAPVLLWSIAFFADYIYEISKLKDGVQKLDKTWSIVSYVMIEVILLALLLNVFIDATWWRIMSIVVIFLSMMTLKASSLYVLCPVQRVERVH